MNGCNATNTVTIAEPSAIATSTSSTPETAADGTATASPSGGTAGYTYMWSPSSQTTATATGLTAGTYTVTVTDANGCSDMQTVVVNAAALGIANNTMQSSITVYPNPTSGTLSVSITSLSNSNCTISVYNAVGQLVYNQAAEIVEGNNVFPVSMEGMEEGLYTIKIISNDGTAVIPVSKLK
jgi:hypothetical protein